MPNASFPPSLLGRPSIQVLPHWSKYGQLTQDELFWECIQ